MNPQPAKKTDLDLHGVDLDVFKSIVDGQTRCTRLLELLAASLDGEEAPHDLARHLEECADCAESYEAMQIVDRAADQAIQASLSRE